jgi:hypothetical protein
MTYIVLYNNNIVTINELNTTKCSPYKLYSVSYNVTTWVLKYKTWVLEEPKGSVQTGVNLGQYISEATYGPDFSENYVVRNIWMLLKSWKSKDSICPKKPVYYHRESLKE